MIEKVKQTIKKFNMLSGGEKVVAALSGGADSVSLLFALKELGYDVSAVHVNHNLRGSDSDADEVFCRELCKKLGVELTVISVNVADYCEKNGLSLEEGARKLRYNAFEEVRDGGKIATAHTLSDCFETAVFNLIRGTGLKGLCSIPPVRDCYIRPLIECSRAEIEQYLRSEGQDYVTDKTNFVDDCSRNIIRLNVVPELMRINPNLMKTFCQTLETLRAENAVLDKAERSLAEKIKINGGYDFSSVDLSDASAARVIKTALVSEGVEPSYEKINRLIKLIRKGGKLNIKNHIYAVSENGILRFNHENNNIVLQIKIPVIENKMFDFAGRKVIIKNVNINACNINKKFANSLVDCDKLKGTVFARNKKDGDRIKLCGRNFTSSVKKLFGSSVEKDKRGTRLMLEDDVGLFWVEGFGCADRVKCCEETKRIMTVEIEG